MSGSTQMLWFVSRASGLALFVLLTAVVVLGVATRQGLSPRRWPRFVTAELHRSLALFTVVFLALHVATAIADPYVHMGWLASVVPFASHYRSFWIGLGALGVDLGAAVLLSSAFRQTLGPRLWKLVHWLAYLAWPAALAHSWGAGNDLHTMWVAGLEVACVASVTVAAAARLVPGRRRPRRRAAGPGRSPCLVNGRPAPLEADA